MKHKFYIALVCLVCFTLFYFFVYVYKPFGERKIRAIRNKVKLETNACQDLDSWAGSYYMGDGLGTSAVFDVALKSGFAFVDEGDLGVWDWNYGKVKLINDKRLKLVFARNNESVWIAEELVIVKWGRRFYLIPSTRMTDFCEAVKEGREPRNEMRGSFFLRIGDSEIEVDGSPDLPGK